MRHYGMRGFGALGAVDFDSASVWANWKAGGSSTVTASKQIQARLNELGFANPPLVVDGDFKQKSTTAYCLMLDKNGAPHNIDGNPCWPGPKGLAFMDPVTPGGGGVKMGSKPVAMCQAPTGEWVPCSQPAGGGDGANKAGMGMGTMLALVVGGVAVVGLLALAAKKKKPGAAGEASAAHPNRRRRRRARKNFSKAEWSAAKRAIKSMKKKSRSRRRR